MISYNAILCSQRVVRNIHYFYFPGYTYNLYSLLQQVLESEGVWDNPIETELINLFKYFKLESEMIVKNQFIQPMLEEINTLRSSDVRLMHRIICIKTGKIYNETLFNTFSIKKKWSPK